MNFLEIKNKKYSFARHVIIFYLLWAFSEMIFFPFLKETNQIFADMFSVIWKIMIWLLPVMMVLKDKGIPIFSYLKLNSNRRKALLWSILGIIFIVTYNISMHILFYNNMKFSPWLIFSQWINTVIIAGLVEEILFRGYFLQELRMKYSFWQANLFVSTLFLSIHFPIWYIHASAVAHGVIAWTQLMIFIFSFSLVQGWLFRKSNSLWPCIMMHMMNNFIALALI